MADKVSIYDLEIRKSDGSNISFSEYKGKKILVVNVASECGYTVQYAQLQELYELAGDHLVIIGCPCNQFGGQEPGTVEEIITFCRKNYGVTFPITEKIEVKGSEQHPLYKWLTDINLNQHSSSEVAWNFQKYLIDESGNLSKVFPSSFSPLDLPFLHQ